MNKQVIVIVVVCIILGALGAIGYASYTKSKSSSSTVFTKIIAPSPTPLPKPPVTLTIPAINVTAAIEDVGLDGQQRMDVPKAPADVGWYDLGPKPGQKGNAVIDGHLDTVTGAPAVFWNLMKLVPGNKIFIIDASGKQYTFDVTSVTQFPVDNFPINQVFGKSNNYMLNLITCGGTWNHARQLYLQRTVIFSKLEQ